MAAQTERHASNLIEFLERLEQHRIHFRLEHNRPETILVDIAVQGERWEVEFLENGDIEVERFVSDGTIRGVEQLESLFDVHGESKF